MPTQEEIDAANREQEARNAAGRNTSEKPGETMIPKGRFDEVNERLKNEKARADALEKAAQAAEEKRLAEQNDYKALYEKQQADITKLKSKAEQTESYEATLQSVLDTQIAALPEDKRALVPEALTTQQKLDWIAKNRAVLMNPAPPDLGAGRTGGGRTPAPKGADLTADEKAIAEQFGLSPEEYAKYRS